MASLSHGARYFTASIHRGPSYCFHKVYTVGKSFLKYRWPLGWITKLNSEFKAELVNIDNDLFRKCMMIRALVEDRVKELARVNKVISRLR